MDRGNGQEATHDSPAAGQDVELLRQALALIEEAGPELYGATSGLSPGGSVGSHVRHCIDFYRCLLDGLPGGRVDYGKRRRDPAEERELEVATAAIRSIIAELAALGDGDRERSLEVREEAPYARSTVARELQFLASHTLHHVALATVILRAVGFSPAPELGVAPATLRHRRPVASS